MVWTQSTSIIRTHTNRIVLKTITSCSDHYLLSNECPPWPYLLNFNFWPNYPINPNYLNPQSSNRSKDCSILFYSSIAFEWVPTWPYSPNFNFWPNYPINPNCLNPQIPNLFKNYCILFYSSIAFEWVPRWQYSLNFNFLHIFKKGFKVGGCFKIGVL